MKKLDSNTVNKLYNSRCHGIKNYFSTVKFLYKVKVSDDGIKTIVKSSNNKFKVFKRVLWWLAKYFLVANEISDTRKSVFHMMLNKYATQFTQYDFKALLNKASNWWLDSSHAKISILIDYCDTLFCDPLLVEEICSETNYTSEYYHKYRKDIITIMRDVQIDSFQKFYKKEVTIQNDKKLYTCTKEILKYRIAGMQMKEIQIGHTLCSPEALKTPLKNQVRQNAQS